MGPLQTNLILKWYDGISKEGVAETLKGQKILLNFELDVRSDLLARNLETGAKIIGMVVGGISNEIRLTK